MLDLIATTMLYEAQRFQDRRKCSWMYSVHHCANDLALMASNNFAEMGG